MWLDVDLRFSESGSKCHRNEQTPDFSGVCSRGSGRSRTDDDGFAIRCPSHNAKRETGSLRPLAPNLAHDFNWLNSDDATRSQQQTDVFVSDDPELMAVIHAWPFLSERDRRVILAMIEPAEEESRPFLRPR